MCVVMDVMIRGMRMRGMRMRVGKGGMGGVGSMVMRMRMISIISG